MFGSSVLGGAGDRGLINNVEGLSVTNTFEAILELKLLLLLFFFFLKILYHVMGFLVNVVEGTTYEVFLL